MTIDSRTQANSRPFVPGSTDTTTTSVVAPASGKPVNPAGMDTPPGSIPTPTGQQTANSVTNTAGQNVDNALVSLLNDNDYDDNVLNAIRNYTYHWKLYMTTEHELVQSAGSADIHAIYKTLDSLPKVVLAESGVTSGFNILAVELDQAVAPGFQNRSAMVTDIQVRIVEPMGSSFIEAMLNAGRVLDVQNFSKFWYFLELTFKGYDENGAIISSPLDPLTLANGGRFIYCININNIDIHMDEAKTEYTLACTPYPETAFSDDGTGFIPENIKVGGSTIKEFCDNLATAMTEVWKKRYAGEIFTFKIINHPIRDSKQDPNGFELTQTEQDPIRGLSFDKDSKKTPQAQIPHGTSLADILVFLYAHCEKAQALMLDTTKSLDLDDEGATYNGKKYRVAMVPMVEADVRVTGYDPITDQYKKEITYNIWAYRSMAANLSPTQQDNIQKDQQVAVDMVNELRKKRYLRKRYYYRYTGQNTEIINFDMRFNMAFAAILPKMAGWRQNTDSVTAHEKINPEVNQSQGSLTNQPNELTVNPVQLNKQIGDINQQLQEAQGQLANAKGKDQQAAQDRINQLRNQQNAVVDQATRIRKANDEAHRQQMESIERQGIKNIYAEDAQGTPLPYKLTYRQAYGEADKATGIGFLGQWHRGESLVGALLNQFYAPQIDGLTSITMDIRGDPYWLGYSSLERRAFVQNPSMDPMPDSRPNYAEGDSAFALVIRFPAGIDAQTGQPIFRSSDMFNGFYRVVGVKSTFENGEFKQTLNANKLELISLLDTAGPSTAPSNQK